MLVKVQNSNINVCLKDDLRADGEKKEFVVEQGVYDVLIILL